MCGHEMHSASNYLYELAVLNFILTVCRFLQVKNVMCHSVKCYWCTYICTTTQKVIR